MTPQLQAAPALPALPERIRQARTISVLRKAIERDAVLFDRWADSTGMVRPGQAVYMRKRAAELRVLLTNHNPAAPAARPDRPAGAGAAETPERRRPASCP